MCACLSHFLVGAADCNAVLHRFDILADAHSSAAIFFGNGNTEQPHLTHFGQVDFGYPVVGYDIGLSWNQTLTNITF